MLIWLLRQTRGASFLACAVEAKLLIDMHKSTEVRRNIFHAVWQRGVMQRIAESVQVVAEETIPNYPSGMVLTDAATYLSDSTITLH